MKRILLLLSFLFLQSCSTQPDKAALDCVATFGTGTKEDIKNNKKDNFILVVNYKDETMTLVINDYSWKVFNPNFSPKRLSFQNPSISDPTQPDPKSYTFIDRNTLKVSGIGDFPLFGSCKKTNLPNLSGSGKQI